LEISSISPFYVAPGDKQKITFTFTANLKKDELNYVINMNPFSISGTTLVATFGGAKPGEYNVIVNKEGVGMSILSNGVTFKTGIEIESIDPLFGSTEGGTEITIIGKNFLTTQLNQIIYIGKNICDYKSGHTHTSTTIKCITRKASDTTIADTNLPVVIEQMIQFSSICPSNNCNFKYDTSKTCKVTAIYSVDGVTKNDYIKANSSTFSVIGTNFGQSFSNYVFPWGTVSTTQSGDAKVNFSITSINTDYYGKLVSLKMHNLFGLCINQPEFPYQTYSDVMIFLKRDDLTFTEVFPLSSGQYGTIMRIYTPNKDLFLSQTTNTIKFCDETCIPFKKNTITLETGAPDTQPSNPRIECYIKKSLNYENCTKMTVSYFSLTKDYTISALNSSAVKNRSFENIKDSTGNLLTTNNFVISTPKNFSIKIVMKDNKIDLADLKIIANDKYEFLATKPGVLVNNIAEYTVNFPNGLPAGEATLSVYENSLGFLLPPTSLSIKTSTGSPTPDFKVKIPLALDAISPSVDITSSFLGGSRYEIKGTNFNNLISSVDTSIDTSTTTSAQSILICGFPANIISTDSKSLFFSTPRIFNTLDANWKDSLPEDYNIMKNTMYEKIVEYSNTDLADVNVSKLNDDNPYTSFKTLLTTTKAIKVKNEYNYKIHLRNLKIFVGDQAKGGDFDKGVIEASDDGVTWTKLKDFPKSLPFMWYTINIDYSGMQKTIFKFIRVKFNAESYIAEVRFMGHVIVDNITSNLLDCPINVLDKINNQSVANLTVKYSSVKTLKLKNINPKFLSSKGNSAVVFTFDDSVSLVQSDVTNMELKLYGKRVDNSAITLVDSKNISVNIPIKDTNSYDRTTPLSIYIKDSGMVNLNGNSFQYLDRWSSTSTWGGEFVPVAGETAYITKADILLDMDFSLNTLVIENGSLTFEDTREYKLSAKIILIRSGELLIGKEGSPFQNKITITLNGENSDPTLPIFGNKVLGVQEGSLQIFGKPKTPHFSQLHETVAKGAKSIKLYEAVNWEVGDEIVIASSSFEPTEAEKRTITVIDRTNINLPIISFENGLEFGHYGAIESYTLDSVTDTFDMRAEVINISRNIVVQGDSKSKNLQYGGHIMLTSMKMNMKQSIGKLSNVEVRNAGQAFQLGRYPIHFHMMGEINGSYVKGCSIHDTFNRAITIHGVNNFKVEENVSYNIMGHSFFIEDSVETDNHIKNNVGILGRASWSLLNTDNNPAIFWMTNPSNFWEGNRACGSEHYGFWMDLPTGATGLNAGLSNYCPRGMPLGSFKNNVSHSNGHYGLRIFPEYNPKNVFCGTVNGTTVTTVPAIFENLFTYRNGRRGFITERIGNLIFKNFKSAENKLSNLEVSDIIKFDGGMATIKDAIVLGVTSNPVSSNLLSGLNTQGIITPRSDNFLIDGVRFHKFTNTNLATFGTCSRCEESGKIFLNN
jgi:hypothetical protein